MTGFVDPRFDPQPPGEALAGIFTSNPEELAQLHLLCREGRLYEVENWIQSGHPLQLAEGIQVKRRTSSALEIALERGDHALALLLLCNGYDPNLEPDCPLDRALQDRRWDLLDLLLDWGADPRDVDLSYLFGTYRSDLWERFMSLGVDLTDGHALAYELAHHTSNKPLFGFARRYRQQDERFQKELNAALAHHAEEGNEKGVQLSLWAGADPRAPACSLRWGCHCRDVDEEEEDRFIGFSAIHNACSRGHVLILEKFKPDPAVDDFEDLYRWADSGAVIDVLARYTLPKDMGRILAWRAYWLRGSPFDSWSASAYRFRDNVERLFRAGARWEASTPDEISSMRSALLKASDHSFVEVMKLLATNDYCSPAILKELVRTPAMHRRMKEVGFIPGSANRNTYRPTRSREVLSKFGVELPRPPKVEPKLARTETIGSWHPKAREIRLQREALFEQVWSKPVWKLAKEWGLSDRGLAKACGRLRVPVPPRGYWAKISAGRPAKRPSLPKLSPGEAEEVVIRVPR